MSLAKEISIGLKKLYEDGMTQDELAKLADVSQAHINRLLSGKRSTAGLALETVDKLFPRATINLHGSGDVGGNTVSGNGNAVGHSNYVVNNGPITQSCIDSVMDRILNTSDLTAEEKVKFLGILRK